MTAICPGGGPSEAKPGLAASVFIGPAVIGAMLNNIPTPWAVGLAGGIGAITYSLSTFCTTDPPAVPTLTAGDALALLNPDPFTYVPALAKFQQLIGAYAWYQLCECTAAVTPAPPAAPAKPADWPDINPTALPQPIAAPCKAVGPISHSITGVQSFNRGGIAISNLGATKSRVTLKNTVSSGGGVQLIFSIQYNYFTPGLTGLRTDTFTLNAGQQVTVVKDVPTGTQEIVCNVAAQGGAGVSLDEFTIEAYCGSDQPGAVMQPCCQPDASLVLQVSQILELVTLMQRQLAPFAYVTGAVHSALAGDGELDIQGLLGVKVALTTIPSSRGVVAGQPDELFDIGFLTFATDDGYPHSVRIEHNPQVILPARASVFTKLAYSLTPGVVATVTELVRES